MMSATFVTTIDQAGQRAGERAGERRAGARSAIASRKLIVQHPAAPTTTLTRLISEPIERSIPPEMIDDRLPARGERERQRVDASDWTSNGPHGTVVAERQ